jgi:hypothetical protein
MFRRIGIFSGLATLGMGIAGVAVWAAWPDPPDIRDWIGDYDTALSPSADPVGGTPTYELTARPPEIIASGTVIDRTAPKGWSHLIIKGLPRLRAGEGAVFPLLTRSETVRMASWMCTAFVADVATDGPDRSARLRAVGLGLGTSVHGRDTIVTASTAKQFGAHLGVFGGEILTKAYEIQAKAVMPIRGPSLGLLDTPVWFRCGHENRLVRYRYALLVDPSTGRLDVLLWSLGADGGQCSELSEIVQVAANTIDEAELVIDRQKVNALGIPADDAFAVDRLPPGRRLKFPVDLRSLAAQTRFTQDDAHRLELRLRTLLTD